MKWFTIVSFAFCDILIILKYFIDDRYKTGPVDSKWLKLTMPVGFEVMQIEPIKSFDIPTNNTQQFLSIKCKIQ